MKGGVCTAMEVTKCTVDKGNISTDKSSMEGSLTECVYDVQG